MSPSNFPQFTHQCTASAKGGHEKQCSHRNFKRDADRAMKTKTAKPKNKPQGFA